MRRRSSQDGELAVEAWRCAAEQQVVQVHRGRSLAQLLLGSEAMELVLGVLSQIEDAAHHIDVRSRLARDGQRVGRDLEQAIVSQVLDLGRVQVQDVKAVASRERAAIEAQRLEAEDDLARHLLAAVEAESAAHRALTRVHLADVRAPVRGVLEDRAVQVGVGRDAHSEQLATAAAPDVGALDVVVLQVTYERVAGGLDIAGALELVDRLEPQRFLFLIGRNSADAGAGVASRVQKGVLVDFHAVDRDVLDVEVDERLQAVIPGLRGLVDHARHQVQVDHWEGVLASPTDSSVDPFAAVRAAVLVEQLVVHGLHTHAQAGNAQLAHGGDLLFGERAWLGLGRPFDIRRDIEVGLEAVCQLGQLLFVQQRGGTAAKVDRIDAPALQLGHLAVGVDLFVDRFEIAIHRLRIAVRIHLVEAEGAALAAVREMHVDAEAALVPRSIDVFRLQRLEWRVAGDEAAPLQLQRVVLRMAIRVAIHTIRVAGTITAVSHAAAP